MLQRPWQVCRECCRVKEKAQDSARRVGSFLSVVAESQRPDMEGDIGGLSVANYDLVDPPPSPSPSRPGLNPPPTQASSAADAVPAVKPPTHVRSRTLTRAVSFPNTSVDADVLRRLRRWMICWAVVEFDLDTGVRAASHAQ